MLRLLAWRFADWRSVCGTFAPLLALGTVLAYARWRTAIALAADRLACRMAFCAWHAGQPARISRQAGRVSIRQHAPAWVDSGHRHRRWPACWRISSPPPPTMRIPPAPELPALAPRGRPPARSALSAGLRAVRGGPHPRAGVVRRVRDGFAAAWPNRSASRAARCLRDKSTARSPARTAAISHLPSSSPARRCCRDDRTLELIHRLKYGREIHLAAELGRLARESFADPRLAPALDGSWPLVPVPLHRKRLRHRHFNQAAEIARVLAGAQRLARAHGPAPDPQHRHANACSAASNAWKTSAGPSKSPARPPLDRILRRPARCSSTTCSPPAPPSTSAPKPSATPASAGWSSSP